MQELVSIIIPTYNRAHLIGQTLDSVLAQTYEHWECIVVDDGSSDYTDELLAFYCEKDSRIKYHHRPADRIKGANACRNHGFELSKGEYIQWFDSDDLMVEDHLIEKLNAIVDRDLDFVIARTHNFEKGSEHEPYRYDEKDHGILASDFILLKIHWYTYDAIIRRKLASKIEWNVNMKSWQDYNYFCKMLLESEKGDYLPKILTHRRIHDVSIQKSLTHNSKTFTLELLDNRIKTYEDIYFIIGFKIRKELIYGMMNLSYEVKLLRKTTRNVTKVISIVKQNLGLKSFLWFKLALFSAKNIKSGYFLLEKAKLK